MGFLDRFIPARKAEANEAVVSAVINANDNAYSSPDASYGNFAREGYVGNELVFACIREIATSTAEAKLCLYDANHEKIENSPLANLVKNPANGQTQYEFLETLITHLQIAGNAYVLKERARVGVVSLMLLRPDRMEVVASGGYSYEINGHKYLIPDEDVGHLKFPNPNNDFYGLSPLQVLAKQINLDTDATTFTKAFFNNAGVPSGILKLRRKLSHQDEADRLRSAWRGQFQGNKNWHRIAILDEDASYEKMGSTIGEMEIPSLRNLSESRICSALGVPAILVGANIGLQRSTFANYAEARESFWEETLLPLYRRIEQFMVGLLEPEFQRERGYLEFDFSEVRALQEDEDALVNRQLVRSQIASQLITAGFTPDAALQAAGIEAELEHTGYLPTSLSVLGQRPVEGKALTQSAANRLLDPLEESYEEEVEAMERVLAKFFKEQLNRADGIMGRYLSQAEPEAKEEKVDVPSFISSNARRGLKYYEEGRAGDGLTPKTVREARQMAAGNVSENKVVRMAAWFARHKSDLEAPKNSNPNHDDYPGAGAVAWLLWGGNPTSSPMRAMQWAERTSGGFEKVALASDQFTTREEAEARAEQLGCSGSHTMEVDGFIVYMPCSTHSSYESIVDDSDTPSATYRRSKKIQMPFNEFTLIPLAADAELAASMSPTLIKTMGRAWETINAANVFTPMPFDPELPIFSNVLRNAGTKINDVSRTALRKQLQVGNQAGYSLDQIVRGVPKDNYRGLRSVVRETYKNRSKTIARTEVATAQNTGTAGRYKAAGVTEVIIQDGDEDDLCAPYDGTRQSIDWALDNPIAHPNCTRAYSAVIDGVTD